MSNYSECQNLHVFVIPKNGINKRTLIPIFNIDSDFSENEEYFREDTLKLGYRTESQRCAEEFFNAYKDIEDPLELIETMVNEMTGFSNGVQTFIIGNSNQSGDFEFAFTEVGDSIVVSIAYIG